MKKFILSLAVIFLAFSAFASPKPVSEALIKKFNETCPSASEVKWFQGEKHSQVTFWQNEVRTVIYYDQQDRVFRTLRYYDGKQLCPFIALKIKEKYQDKSIKSVAELTDNVEGLLYEIILEDSNRLYIVHSDGSGNLQMIKKLIKA